VTDTLHSPTLLSAEVDVYTYTQGTHSCRDTHRPQKLAGQKPWDWELLIMRGGQRRPANGSQLREHRQCVPHWSTEWAVWGQRVLAGEWRRSNSSAKIGGIREGFPEAGQCSLEREAGISQASTLIGTGLRLSLLAIK
jgi:hypothetical protein